MKAVDIFVITGSILFSVGVGCFGFLVIRALNNLVEE